MKLKSKTVLAILAVVLLTVIAAMRPWRAPDGPTFEGRTVSEWIDAEPWRQTLALNHFGAQASAPLFEILQMEKGQWDAVWNKLPSVVQTGIAQLSPPNLDRRHQAALSWLIALGEESTVPVEALRRHLQKAVMKRDTLFGSDLVLAGRLHPNNRELRELVLGLLKSHKVQDIGMGCSAAAAYGEQGGIFAPSLRTTLAHTNKWVMQASLAALGELGPAGADAALEVARLAARDDSPSSDLAIRVLREFGPLHDPVVPTIAEVLPKASQSQQFELLCLLLTATNANPSSARFVQQLRTPETNAFQALLKITASHLLGDTNETRRAWREAIDSNWRGDELTDWTASVNYPRPGRTFRLNGGVMTLRGHPALYHLTAELAPKAPEFSEPLRKRDASSYAAILCDRAIWKVSGKTNGVLPSMLQAIHVREDPLSVTLAMQTLEEMPLDASAAPALLQFVNNHSNPWESRRRVRKILQAIESRADKTPR